MNLTMTDIMSMIVGGQMKHTYVTAEDQLKRVRKKENAYESCEIGMAKYSSTGEIVESDLVDIVSTYSYCS